MGDAQSAQREDREGAAAEEEAADAPLDHNIEAKPLRNNGQISEINGKVDSTIAEVDYHCEEEIVPEESDVSQMPPENIEINQKESLDTTDATDQVPLEMTVMDAKQNDINEGFKRFFSNIGLKLTVKRGSAEDEGLKDEITTEETDNKELTSPEDTEDSASELKSANAEQSVDQNTQGTNDGDSTTCPTLTDGTSEDVPEKTEESEKVDTATVPPVVGDVKEQQDEPLKEDPTSPSSPEAEEVLSPVKKFFTTGIFSGLKKKKKQMEDEITEKELVDMAGKETGETTQVQQDQEEKGKGESNEAKEDDGKSPSTSPVTITVNEPETTSAQDKTQDSPLKWFLSGSSLKKISKKQKGRKSSATMLSDSEEPASDQPKTPAKSSESQQEEKPEQPSMEAAEEESSAWASFKKLVTPKKHMKMPSLTVEETQIPAEETKLSDKEHLSDHSTEEGKKRKDSSWEAVLCGSGRRRSRSRKTSDSEDESPHVEDGGKKQESPLESSNEVETSAVSPKTGSPTEGEGGSTWKSFKKLVTPKRKARDEEESKDNIQSDGEATQDDSSFSIKKLLPRKKKKSVENQDQQSSDEADKEAVSADEDSDTPAVIPLSEFDIVESDVQIETKADVESHEAKEPNYQLQQDLLDQTSLPVPPKESQQTEAMDDQEDKDGVKTETTKDLSLNKEPEDRTELISKHQQLSDIPEEGVITETNATPDSVSEEVAQDDTIAEDLIEISSDAITTPEPLDFTTADETEMVSAVSQLSESSKTSGDTTPVPVEYDVKTTEALLSQVAETISMSPVEVPLCSEEVSSERIVSSVSQQILEKSVEEEPAILVMCEKTDVASVGTELSVRSQAEAMEAESTETPQVDSQVAESAATKFEEIKNEGVEDEVQTLAQREEQIMDHGQDKPAEVEEEQQLPAATLDSEEESVEVLEKEETSEEETVTEKPTEETGPDTEYHAEADKDNKHQEDATQTAHAEEPKTAQTSLSDLGEDDAQTLEEIREEVPGADTVTEENQEETELVMGGAIPAQETTLDKPDEEPEPLTEKSLEAETEIKQKEDTLITEHAEEPEVSETEQTAGTELEEDNAHFQEEQVESDVSPAEDTDTEKTRERSEPEKQEETDTVKPKEETEPLTEETEDKLQVEAAEAAKATAEVAAATEEGADAAEAAEEAPEAAEADAEAAKAAAEAAETAAEEAPEAAEADAEADAEAAEADAEVAEAAAEAAEATVVAAESAEAAETAAEATVEAAEAAKAPEATIEALEAAAEAAKATEEAAEAAKATEEAAEAAPEAAEATEEAAEAAEAVKAAAEAAEAAETTVEVAEVAPEAATATEEAAEATVEAAEATVEAAEVAPEAATATEEAAEAAPEAATATEEAAEAAPEAVTASEEDAEAAPEAVTATEEAAEAAPEAVTATEEAAEAAPEAVTATEEAAEAAPEGAEATVEAAEAAEATVEAAEEPAEAVEETAEAAGAAEEEPGVSDILQTITSDSEDLSAQLLEKEGTGGESLAEEIEPEPECVAEANDDVFHAEINTLAVLGTLEDVQAPMLDSDKDSVQSTEREVILDTITEAEMTSDEPKQELAPPTEVTEQVDGEEQQVLEDAQGPVLEPVEEAATEPEVEVSSLDQEVTSIVEGESAKDLSKQEPFEDAPKSDTTYFVTVESETQIELENNHDLHKNEDQQPEITPQDVCIGPEDQIPEVVEERETLAAVQSTVTDEASVAQVREMNVLSETYQAPSAETATVSQEPKHEVHLSSVHSSVNADRSEIPGFDIRKAVVKHAIVSQVTTCYLKDVAAAIPNALIETPLESSEPLIDSVASELGFNETNEAAAPFVLKYAPKTGAEGSVVKMINVPSVQFDDNHRIQVQVVDVDVKSAKMVVDTALEVGVTETKGLIDECQQTFEEVDKLAAKSETEETVMSEEHNLIIQEVTQHEKENLPEIVVESVLADLGKTPEAEVEDQKLESKERQDEVSLVASDDFTTERVLKDQSSDIPGSSDVLIHDLKEEVKEPKLELKKFEADVASEESSPDMKITQEAQTQQIAQTQIETRNSGLLVPQNTGVISSVGNVDSPSSLSLEFKLNIHFGHAKEPASSPPPSTERTEPVKQTDVADVGVQVVAPTEEIHPAQCAEKHTEMADVGIQVAESKEDIDATQCAEKVIETYVGNVGIQVQEPEVETNPAQPVENLKLANLAEVGNQVVEPKNEIILAQSSERQEQMELIEAAVQHREIPELEKEDPMDRPVIMNQPVVLNTNMQTVEIVEPFEQVETSERLLPNVQVTEMIQTVKQKETVVLNKPQLSECPDQDSKPEQPAEQVEEEAEQDVWMDAEEDLYNQEETEKFLCAVEEESPVIQTESVQVEETVEPGELIEFETASSCVEEVGSEEEMLETEGKCDTESEGEDFAVAHEDPEETAITPTEWD